MKLTTSQLAALGYTIDGDRARKDVPPGPSPGVVTITLPLPPKELSPNHMVGSRGGRFAKARKAKAYRLQAKGETMAATQGWSDTPWPFAIATPTFYWPTRSRRDPLNALASLKAAWDGIVDAGLLEDDDYRHLRCEPAVFEWDKENPRVEIKMEKGEQA